MTDYAKWNLEAGTQWPYDAPDGEGFVVEGDWAYRAARGVVANLCDRRGIKHGFEEIDPDIRREIIETLADIIRMAKEEDDGKK